MKKLILMCGCPGAGKSHYLNVVVSSGMGEIAISRDKIRYSMIKGKEDYFSKENEVFDEYIRQIQAALDNPKIYRVYADATQLTEKSRNKVLDRLNLDNVSVSIIWKNTPLELCLQRNKQREPLEVVPEEQVRKMYRKMQDPRKDKKYKYEEVRVI